MSPLPIVVLLPAVRMTELPIVSMPFAKIDPVGMILAVIPLMVVMMIPIVVPRMIDSGPDYDFLSSGRFWHSRDSECGSQEQKAQIFSC